LHRVRRRSPDANVDAVIDHVNGLAAERNAACDVFEEPMLLDDAMTDRLAVHLIRRESPDRLLDEISLLLHRPVSALAEDQRQMLEKLHEDDAVLNGRRVLIVDDDVRNIFALTSVLERYNMHILSAETGRDAIQILQDTPDIDAVLHRIFGLR
jgi:CheY-like chemotaxis protein